MKIVIIGAGIAGLTLGLACRRAGIEVEIYEKAHELRNIGGGILLWPHGQRYLEWLGLSSCLTPFSVPIKGCRIIGHQGQLIFSEDYASFYSLIEGEILPVDRHQLQHTLLNALGQSYVKLGKPCVAIQQDEHQAHAIFADGSQVSADIIVGADGIHSTVRKSLNEEACLAYTEHCWWGGIIAQQEVPHLSPHEVFMAMGVGKMCVVWPTSGQRFMWYMPVKMPLTSFVQKGDGLSQLQALAADWPLAIQAMLTSPYNAKRFHLPIYNLAPQPHWTLNRVVLIGDAAHTLGPILGQGASQAIEDVFALTLFLQHGVNDIPATLRQYEHCRRAKYQRMADLENQTASMMLHDKRETLALFEQHAKDLDLMTIYQDLIPLVDESACRQLKRRAGACVI
jgi:FAD-dependent urate hydroxylase